MFLSVSQLDWKWQRYGRRAVTREMYQFLVLAIMVTVFGAVVGLGLVPLNEMCKEVCL